MPSVGLAYTFFMYKANIGNAVLAPSPKPGRSEVDIAVLAACPYTGNQLRRDADKPTVGVILCGTCFAANRVC